MTRLMVEKEAIRNRLKTKKREVVESQLRERDECIEQLHQELRVAQQSKVLWSVVNTTIDRMWSMSMHC